MCMNEAMWELALCYIWSSGIWLITIESSCSNLKSIAFSNIRHLVNYTCSKGMMIQLKPVPRYDHNHSWNVPHVNHNVWAKNKCCLVELEWYFICLKVKALVWIFTGIFSNLRYFLIISELRLGILIVRASLSFSVPFISVSHAPITMGQTALCLSLCSFELRRRGGAGRHPGREGIKSQRKNLMKAKVFPACFRLWCEDIYTGQKQTLNSSLCPCVSLSL